MAERFEYLLQFFEYDHLPQVLRPISQPFHAMAHDIVKNLPMNPERTNALRKLLESKDSAVRSFLYKSDE